MSKRFDQTPARIVSSTKPGDLVYTPKSDLVGHSKIIQNYLKLFKIFKIFLKYTPK